MRKSLGLTINYSDRALKSLRKMDKQNARRIVDFMSLRIAVAADPRQSGKPLKGELGEFWRYRVGDYRVLCEIRDDELVILAATIGHRREVYD
ncbi:type II toxin-antitoxin system RelE family toxin [Klebsiella pneumoniae]|nr:type II toxin-antitoxin system RelE/ParE family toxin [Klebsiella pneumoniae]